MLLLRGCGIKTIVNHDHSFFRPACAQFGIRRLRAAPCVQSLPLLDVIHYIAVSDFSFLTRLWMTQVCRRTGFLRTQWHRTDRN